ncbi:MAG TPA: hypothetical protein VGF14_02445 [Alphaproteobacteria bacterium]
MSVSAYQSNQVSTSYPNHVKHEYFTLFEKAASVYAYQHADGDIQDNDYFVQRIEDGFLIAPAKIIGFGKSFDPQSISLVHSYHRDTNILSWSGEVQPPSGAGSIAILFSDLPHIDSVFHSDAELMTNNPTAKTPRVKVTEPLPSSDEATLGKMLVETLLLGNTNNIIVPGQGEFFIGGNTVQNNEDLTTLLQRTVKQTKLASQPVPAVS